MTVQYFDAHAQRDMVQHHVVAALAEIGEDRLVFKGGTLLRVCVFEDYRWSEDLDFDWAGSPEGFRALVDAAVAQAAASVDIPTLTTETAGAVNVTIVAPEMPAPIRAEATMRAERDDSVPTQLWRINPRWGTNTDTAAIVGYTATADRHLVMIRRCPDPEQCPLCALGAGLCTGCRQGPPDDGYRTCERCRRKRRRRDRDRRHLAALDRAAEARRMTRTDLLRTLRSG